MASGGFPKIAIIGSGPAGLTLAHVLHRGGVPYTIYEAEPSLTSRRQGGPVNFRYDRGERILRALGLYDIYEKSMYTPGCEVSTLGDKTGKIFLHHSEDENGNYYSAWNSPLVNRCEIRRLFLNQLPSDSVRWNSKVQAVSSGEENTYDITFSDGSIEKGFDLVVGADGAWSKVRPLVSDVQPHYAGQCYLETEIQDLTKAPKSVTDLIKRGTYCFPDPNACLVAQRDGNKSIWIYAVVQGKPESWIQDPGFDVKDVEGAKKAFLEQYWSGWSEDLKAVVINSDTDITPRAFYMLPVGHEWEHRAGVTVIGDAAHCMTPWGGSGANLALEDGYELGEAILIQGKFNHWKKGEKFVSHKALDAAVKEFETAMFPRAVKDTERAVRNIEFFKMEGAPEKMFHFIKSMSV